jgi:precorrin-2 dehydrogenase/sirohydrochlorin ferrochelatase
MTSNKLYPIFLKLSNKNILIIGGGFIALQKLIGLINTDAKITVIAPTIIEEVRNLEGEFPFKRNIKFIEREYEFGDEKGAFMVISATNISELNNTIANRCRDQGILVNSVDEPDYCDFYVPSIAEHGEIKIAISSNGKAPSVSQKIRKDLELELKTKYSKLIPLISEFRKKVHQKIPGQMNFNRRAKLIRWYTDRIFKKIDKGDLANV